MSFKTAMLDVRRSEGGYVFDPDDKGGETYCGVARRFFPKWEGWGIIDRIKKNSGRKIKTNEKFNDYKLNKMIEAFYYKYFWVPLKCHKIKDSLVAEHLFDCGINLGKRSAVRFIQKTINKHFKNCLVEDGLIGPATISKLNGANSQFANVIVQERINLYFSKCYAKNVKFKWLRGWALRSLKYTRKP